MKKKCEEKKIIHNLISDFRATSDLEEREREKIHTHEDCNVNEDMIRKKKKKKKIAMLF